MSKRANPTLVGGFILGAIGLAVAGVAAFGSASLLRDRPRVVAYFEGTVQGLGVGAPVNLRGVRIGSVSNIRIDIQEQHPEIPVYMELNPESLNRMDSKRADISDLPQAIEKGLRAKLVPQSFVTGQLLVELDFVPGAPARFVGWDKSTPEIPTIESDVERLKDTLSQLPLQDLVGSALKTINDLDRLLTSPEIPAMLSSLASASANGDRLLAETRANQVALIARMTETLDAFNSNLPEVRKVLTGTQAVLKTTNEGLAPSLRTTLHATEGAMRQAERTLADADSLLATNSPLRADLAESLRNIAAASRSMRSLFDQLDRKPNAIVVGR
jgi:paraquat-inducible protein B